LNVDLALQSWSRDPGAKVISNLDNLDIRHKGLGLELESFNKARPYGITSNFLSQAISASAPST